MVRPFQTEADFGFPPPASWHRFSMPEFLSAMLSTINAARTRPGVNCALALLMFFSGAELKAAELGAQLAYDTSKSEPGLKPERVVTGNVITSARDPKVSIELPKSVRYLGADRWVLYGIADCELHALVEADEQKNVQRLYWVQFEGYLASKPELKHQYDSVRHVRINGWDFYVDTWVEGTTDEPGSDSEHIKELIRAAGYKLSEALISVRLVHLLDEQKRRELMIIYSEDISGIGVPAADLRKGGRARGRWPAMQEELIKRGLSRILLREDK